MNKYTFSVNGASFRTATGALRQVNKLKKEKVKIGTLRINGEPLALSALEAESRQEAAERAHNKRQGL